MNSPDPDAYAERGRQVHRPVGIDEVGIRLLPKQGSGQSKEVVVAVHQVGRDKDDLRRNDDGQQHQPEKQRFTLELEPREAIAHDRTGAQLQK